MDLQEQAIYKLRETIEQVAGKRMVSSKDYEYLSAIISEQSNLNVSSSTLKRLYGYYNEGVTPRRSTLDLLSRFLGYKDFDAFCEEQGFGKSNITMDEEPETDLEQSFSSSVQTTGHSEQLPDEDTPEQKTSDAGHRHAGKTLRRPLFLLLFFAVVILIAIFAVRRGNDEATSNTTPTPQILRKGQKFASFDEYLSLFGITANEMQWYQPVPYHNGIVLWGPQYNHPEWHNEGDSALLMPTITEYWTPAPDAVDIPSQRVVDHMRSEAYFLALRLNEVRLTFMHGLTDSTFTFLGVYRMSVEQSDTTRIVYERVGDEVNLSDLDYLQRLRR